MGTRPRRADPRFQRLQQRLLAVKANAPTRIQYRLRQGGKTRLRNSGIDAQIQRHLGQLAALRQPFHQVIIGLDIESRIGAQPGQLMPERARLARQFRRGRGLRGRAPGRAVRRCLIAPGLIPPGRMRRGARRVGC